MGDPHGFLKLGRSKERELPVSERTTHYGEFTVPLPDADVAAQASRCMDCGIPFCHSGCPLGNLIPEWNDLVYQGRTDEAVARLFETNNFPEVTGRVCPAPCEAACVLGRENVPVAIKLVEKTIAERALREGRFEPMAIAEETHRSVAVVGSGPAGLAAAQQLARMGHSVTLFERDSRAGGLLRYGIPDFKLDKTWLDLRIAQMRAEGVRFETNVDIGGSLRLAELRSRFDAIVLCVGSRRPRDLDIPGRQLAGVHFAMEFLGQQNRRVGGESISDAPPILATGKRVVVIGGGDTGSDCVGTSIRQKATSVTQIELFPEPPTGRQPHNPWPEWPLILRTSSSHEEGAARDWAIATRAFRGEGQVSALSAVRVRLESNRLVDIENSNFDIPADLVLLAMGFVGPDLSGMQDDLGVSLDTRGNIVTKESGATNVEGVFAAGDASRGQSLVVWAIADGRRVAAGVDAYLRKRRR